MSDSTPQKLVRDPVSIQIRMMMMWYYCIVYVLLFCVIHVLVNLCMYIYVCYMFKIID